MHICEMSKKMENGFLVETCSCGNVVFSVPLKDGEEYQLKGGVSNSPFEALRYDEKLILLQLSQLQEELNLCRSAMAELS
jgi:hypothetical protein